MYAGQKENYTTLFFIFNMPRGIDRWRVRPMSSHNMVVLGLKGTTQVMIAYSCYRQFTPAKTMYLLTNITSPYRGFRLRSFVFFFQFPAVEALVNFCNHELRFQAWPNLYIIEKKRKPLNLFSRGYHGQRYCSWVGLYNDGKVAQHGGYTSAN